MPDKEMVQAVLDAIGVTRAGRSESGRSRCDHHDEDCAAPENVIYVILTNCVTINNAPVRSGSSAQAGADAPTRKPKPKIVGKSCTGLRLLQGHPALPSSSKQAN